MKYVYLLQSLAAPQQRYIGVTGDLQERRRQHNAGKSPHTAKYGPWEAIVVVRFKDEKKAVAFEKYLKVGSGHAFAKRHFW